MAIEEELRRLVKEEVACALDPVLERLRAIQAELVAQKPRTEVAFLTPHQAAQLLGVTSETIREWIKAGRLTAHGGQGALRVSRSELLALRPGQRRPPEAPDATNRDIEERAAEIISGLERRQDREAG